MYVASLRSSVDDGFSVFFAWLPHVLGFIAVLLIGYFVAKLVGSLVARGTGRAGLDRTVHGGVGGAMIQRVVPSPSRLLGRLAFWAIFLGALSLAASVLGIAALTAFVGAIWAYIPHVVEALLIFLVAGAVSAAVAALVQRTMGETALGKVVSATAPILIMTIATFMILDALQIAPRIVTITYAALLGAIALGSALAFGLGGRDVARQVLEGAYEKGQDNKEQLRQDLDTGIERGKAQMQDGRPATQPATQL